MQHAITAPSGGPSELTPERAHELLWSGTPPEVLARLVPGDPLGLRARVARRLAERALLCDAERVLLIAQVQCALHAAAWRGAPELEVWLAERIEEALGVVLAEQAAPGSGRSEIPRALAEPLGLAPERLAMGCARFNRLPFEQREAFFALVLDGAGLDRLARARGLSLPELARRARAGLQAFRSLASAPRAICPTAS